MRVWGRSEARGGNCSNVFLDACVPLAKSVRQMQPDSHEPSPGENPNDILSPSGHALRGRRHIGRQRDVSDRYAGPRREQTEGAIASDPDAASI